MKEQQVKKNCQAFISKLQNTNVYENVKDLLLGWKRQDKQNVPAAVDAFMKITKVVHGFGHDQKDDRLIQYFNRCLQKDAIVPKKTVTSDFVQQAANENPQSNQIIDKVQDWIKKQIKAPEKAPPPKQIVTIEEIKDNSLFPRLESHINFRDIVKILQLYLKSIITFEEFKTLIQPLFHTDPSLITCLIQTGEEIIQKRRKATVFAPLNQLVDKKYPNLEQVGESYILIPEGYANYGKNWKTNQFEYIMNRKCVSVPLGSEVSFIINKKTDYQQQLFNYEDQRYQIDNALTSLKAVISLLSCAGQLSTKLDTPLVQKIINQLYPSQNVGSIFIRNPQIAKILLLPRVIQKRDELMACREKFIKNCQQVASRNFYKSLDYRCFYFAKNDKKFNCPMRWQKQIEMRKQQIKQNKDIVQQEQIQDRQSLQRGRYFYVNSFDNITKQNFIQNKQIQKKYDHKINAAYPCYPQNQILFILNFTEQQIFNDVLEIILYNCTRKNLLELLIFKMMRTDIKKRLKKSPFINYLIQTKQKIASNPQIIEFYSNIENAQFMKSLEQQGYPPNEQVILNDTKGLTKTFKDSEDQFMQMIQEDEQPVQIQDQASPFQGPNSGYTFICTKQIYLFMRYVTAIYQRFLKAKQYSDQFSTTLMTSGDNDERQRPQIDIYKFFLNVMIYKIKDRKYFEEYLRKLFCKNAFIFFTLQKMILSAAKTISNITAQSLTFQIIKDQTKDYELGAFDWQKYVFPSITMQLTRLYLQNQSLFRFTFEPSQRNFYISAWSPPFKQGFTLHQKSQQLAVKMQRFTTEPIRVRKQKIKNKKLQRSLQKYNGEQITKDQGGKLILRGQLVILSKERHEKWDWQKQLKQELNKIKVMKKLI